MAFGSPSSGQGLQEQSGKCTRPGLQPAHPRHAPSLPRELPVLAWRRGLPGRWVLLAEILGAPPAPADLALPAPGCDSRDPNNQCLGCAPPTKGRVAESVGAGLGGAGTGRVRVAAPGAAPLSCQQPPGRSRGPSTPRRAVRRLKEAHSHTLPDPLFSAWWKQDGCCKCWLRPLGFLSFK